MLVQDDPYAAKRVNTADQGAVLTEPGPPRKKPALPARPDKPAELLQAGWYLSFKRALDLALAGLLLVLTSPLIVLASLLVKLTSRGPIFYSQVRLGLHGLPFTIYKVRTMRHNCECLSGPRWASMGDPRITRVGRFLRRTHIDELPQLWNVLCGHMSLIGPRPERPEFVPQLAQVIPHYRDRLLVRPGVTGLAQVQLPPDTDLASVRRKLACDLYYVQHVGGWLELKIMLATIFYLLKVPFAVSRFLFGVPSGQPVEHAYNRLIADEKAVSETPACGLAVHC